MASIVMDTHTAARGPLPAWPLDLEAGASRRYRSGDVIFHAGEPANEALLVDEGFVKLVALTPEGRSRILAVLGPGDVAASAVLAPEGSYRADAVAQGAVAARRVSRERLVARAARDPEATLRLAEAIVRDLDRAWEQLASAYLPVKARLAIVLLDQTRRFGTPGPGGGRLLDVGLSHDDLAAMIGANRVSVSTAMAELRLARVLEGSRGRYRVDLGRLACTVGEPADAARA